MGSWIGGDRDGNPNVNGGTMEHALTRQATTILDFYLEEAHTLGAELSVSTLMIACQPRALQALADAVARPVRRTAADEPYRRALIGIYARLASHRPRAGRDQHPAQAKSGHAEPYLGGRRVLRPTCKCWSIRCNANHGAAAGASRACPP